MADTLPPGIAGFAAGQQANAARQQSMLSGVLGVGQLQGLLGQQQLQQLQIANMMRNQKIAEALISPLLSRMNSGAQATGSPGEPPIGAISTPTGPQNAFTGQPIAPAASGPAPASGDPFGGVNPYALALKAAAGDFSGMGTLVGQATMPTDEMKNAAAAFGVGSPQYQQAVKNVAVKAGYIPPTPVRPGGWTTDQNGNRQFFPNNPPASIPLDPNNPAAGVVPVPGAANVMGINAAATAGGKAQFTNKEVTLSDGRKISVPDSVIAKGPAAVAQWIGSQSGNPMPAPLTPNSPGMQIPPQVQAQRDAEAKALKDNEANVAAGQPSAFPLAAPVAMGVGQSTASAEAARANEQELAQEAAKGREAANLAVDTNYNLQQILKTAEGFNTGQFAPTMAGVRKFVQGTAPGLFPDSEMEKLKNFQEFQKYSIRLGFDQARKMGARESTQIVQMSIESNPNPGMVGPAIVSITHGLMAQNDYVIAKEQARDAWRGQHDGTLSGFNSAWQANADPRAFLVKYLTPQEQTNLFNKMGPQDRQKLLNNLKSLRQQGLL